jgi:hypothetical protein
VQLLASQKAKVTRNSYVGGLSQSRKTRKSWMVHWSNAVTGDWKCQGSVLLSWNMVPDMTVLWHYPYSVFICDQLNKKIRSLLMACDYVPVLYWCRDGARLVIMYGTGLCIGTVLVQGWS